MSSNPLDPKCPLCEELLCKYYYSDDDGETVFDKDDFIYICVEPQCPNVLVSEVEE